MKLNRSTIFLLIALLAIWGGIVYSVYKKMKSDNTEQVMTSKIFEKTQTDSFSLLLNYNNPFISSAIDVNTNKLKIGREAKQYTQNEVEVKAANKSTKTPLKLSYLGLIDTKGKRSTLILIVVNGEEHLLPIGSVCEDFTVVAATQTELKVKKGKEIIVIDRE